MSGRVSIQHVLQVIAALEAWENGGHLRALEWGCQRCRVAVGQACRRPDGQPLLRRGGSLIHAYHAPRLDRYFAVIHGTPVKAWRSELVDYGDPPSMVLAQIEQSRLYRHLLKTGRINRTKGRDEWTEAQLSAAK